MIIVLSFALLPFGMQAQQRCSASPQLTDLHRPRQPESHGRPLFALRCWINATDSIDFVLVTGDITEEGDRATMEKVKSCLDTLKMKYYVVSGNHETEMERLRLHLLSEKYSATNDSGSDLRFLFLGFNSGPLMRMAYGHVVPQDINWMTEKNGEKAAKGNR